MLKSLLLNSAALNIPQIQNAITRVFIEMFRPNFQDMLSIIVETLKVKSEFNILKLNSI